MVAEISIQKYLETKAKYEQEITQFVAEKAKQFEDEIGLNVQDVYIFTANVSSIGSENKSIVTAAQIKTKLSD